MKNFIGIKSIPEIYVPIKKKQICHHGIFTVYVQTHHNTNNTVQKNNSRVNSWREVFSQENSTVLYCTVRRDITINNTICRKIITFIVFIFSKITFFFDTEVSS